MNAPHRHTPTRPVRTSGSRPHSFTPPATIWLPTQPATDTAPTSQSAAADRARARTPSETGDWGVLPAWAVERIRAEFTRPRHPGQLPLPMLRLSIPDHRPGMDARTRCTGDTAGVFARRAVILAELHPDALPAHTGGTHPEAAQHEEWPGFFHRTHRLLARGGFLLVAARQQRTAGRLCDPLGALVACARTAGFIYLQHIVVVHGHAAGDRIVPAPVPGMPPGLLHSDLLFFQTVGLRN